MNRDSVVVRPNQPMHLAEARAYMLELVNHDRHEHGLPALPRDEIAERAGQVHAADMAEHGYTAHWGTDGSVPEERYTVAGGRDFVQENAACFGDGVHRDLDPNPVFSAQELEEIEQAFMAEKPPADGHRRNILKNTHSAVGFGLAQSVSLGRPCLAQEFVDRKGSYGSLPKTARIGQRITIEGEVSAPVEFGGVGIGRIEPRRPLSPSHLNGTSSYPVPQPYAIYFPKGFVTPKPVQMNGRHFSITLPLSDRGRPGRYEISIWGRYPGDGNQLNMVSLRTIEVR